MPMTNAKPTHKRCVCPTCGEVFSTIANFDRHRKGDYETGRVCVDPASVGMEIKVGSGGSWWGMPGNFRPRKGESVPMYRIAAKNGVAAGQ